MIVAFPHRSPDPATTVAALASLKMSTCPRCAIVVTKGDRERRYAIREDTPSRWVGEVWFGVALHRRRVALGVHEARRLVWQFTRELQDLLADGWAESPG